MLRLLRFSCAVLLLACLPCFASSITHIRNVNVRLEFLPNEGTGGNVWGTLDGSGASLAITGGTGASWFAAPYGFAPGSHEEGGTTIYVDDVSGTLGNKSYDFLSTSTADFKAGGLTFPTNGKDFTISVRGSLGIFVVYGCNSQGCDQYNLTTNPGILTVSFSFSGSDGLYYANNASFVSTTSAPEPSTFALLAIGFGALPWLKSRKRFLVR